MKNILILIFLLAQISGWSQTKFLTKTATIEFVGSVDSFEPIQAVNSKTTVVLDDQGKLAALVLIKGFRFPVALMQEHFNENYMESDDYPKAVLRGQLVNFTSLMPNSKPIVYQFKGVLEMHGIKNDISFPVTVAYTDNSYAIDSTFQIDPTQYDIEIPKVVRNKIAETITVKVNALLKK